jgi:dihydroorotate dehydrogenase electron transfer subunit
MARQETSIVLQQTKLAPGIYSLSLQTDQIAPEAQVGQFLSLFSKDGSRLLPRPISICEIDKEKKTLRLVYKVLGKGTEEFSKLTEGDTLKIMGPLGNGFPLKDKKALIIGGGIGIPPLLQLTKELDETFDCEKNIVLGYRDEVFLKEEFEPLGSTFIATQDGSQGTRGTVIDAIHAEELKADIIYACGPTPMLRAVKKFAEENQIECWLSLEERMACGIGACLACVCQSKETDTHTGVHNKRICVDGPVFLAEEVEL